IIRTTYFSLGRIKEMTRSTDQVVAVLSEVKELLARSQPAVWAALTPAEVMTIIEQETNAVIQSGRFHNKAQLVSLFAPTAEIQEISMANHWSDDYMRLAEAFEAAAKNISNAP